MFFFSPQKHNYASVFSRSNDSCSAIRNHPCVCAMSITRMSIKCRHKINACTSLVAMLLCLVASIIRLIHFNGWADGSCRRFCGTLFVFCCFLRCFFFPFPCELFQNGTHLHVILLKRCRHHGVVFAFINRTLHLVASWHGRKHCLAKTVRGWISLRNFPTAKSKCWTNS